MKKFAIIILALVFAFFAMTVYAEELAKINLSLDIASAEKGNLPDTVTMTIKASEPIVPIQLSGESYSSNENIKIIDIIDGDKELCSNAKTGRFAWLGARNEKEVIEFAKIVFELPNDLPVGNYTFGVRSASATDRNGAEILSASEQTITFTVTNPQRNVFPNFFRWSFFRWW